MTKTTDIIGAVVALVGLGGLLLTMWTFLQRQSDRAARDDVGRVCSKSSMGYFAAKTPWWFSGKETPLPWVPTLSGLIKAGEDLAYTSTMFDQIPNSHEEVGWKKIYEAFFDEVAWDLDCHQLSWGWNYLEKVMKTKQRKMTMAISGVSGDGPDRHLMYTSSLVKNLLVTRRSRFELGRLLEIGLRSGRIGIHLSVLARCLKRPRLPVGQEESEWSSLKACSGELGELSTREAVQSKNSGRLKLPDAKRARQRPLWASELEHDQCLVWVRDGKPSIEVSRAELAALQFLLGMRLEITHDQTGRMFSLKGSGAFGILLNGELAGINGEYCRLRLTHYRYKPWQQPSKGSGYSMLMAKYMACGFLPFAQDEYQTHCVEITPDVLKAILKQHNIQDAVTEQTSLCDYLECLPGLTRRVSYSGSVEPSHTGEEPLVLDQQGKKVGKWCEAVAGIAFGGMVPLATPQLVQAVRFTASGGEGLGDAVYQLDKLMTLEEFQIQEDPELTGLNLFGPYKGHQLQHSSDIDIPLFDDPTTLSLRDATSMLGRYMTRLERLACLAMRTTGEGECDFAERLFEECVKRLEVSYNDSRTRQDANWRTARGCDRVAYAHQPAADVRETNIGKLLANVMRRITRQNRSLLVETITIEICTEIARLLIAVWTYHVTIVVAFDSDEELKAANKWFEGEKPRVLRPVEFRKLPRVSLLQ